MSQTVLSLSEHFKCFSAVSLNAEHTAAAQRNSLCKFGTVSESRFIDFSEALDFILPLKSFTKRFLVFGLDTWSIIISDMSGENCHVDAYSVCRAASCNGVGISLREDRREFYLFKNGALVRQIQSLDDGDRWFYQEQGLIQDFEEIADNRRKRKQDRLGVEVVRRYFQQCTGVKIPEWKQAKFDTILGLERSIADLRVPVYEYSVIDDL